MKTIVEFGEMVMQSNSFVRFTCDNVPHLLVGDTFVLPLMANLGLATVKKRHWQGHQLVLSCAVNKNLLAYLKEKSVKVKGCMFNYELPEQDWSQPFEASSKDFIESQRFLR